jgi:Fis family transcriptional regulator
MNYSGDRSDEGPRGDGTAATGREAGHRNGARAPAEAQGLRSTPVSRNACRMNQTQPDGCGGPAATPLKRCVSEELARYFEALDGQKPCDLHKMVVGETEQALLQFVLEHTGGNQSRAAQLLGLNRGTLRKKLQYYALI